MITASIRFKVSAKARDKLRDVLVTLLGPTQAMSGCISCRLYQEQTEPESWLLLEEWASEEDMKRHIESADYYRVLQAMELSYQAPEVKFSSLAKTDGFKFIETIRKQK